MFSLDGRVAIQFVALIFRRQANLLAEVASALASIFCAHHLFLLLERALQHYSIAHNHPDGEPWPLDALGRIKRLPNIIIKAFGLNYVKDKSASIDFWNHSKA